MAEATIVYDLVLPDAAPQNSGLAGTVKHVYIKGHKARVDLVTPALKQVYIYDAKTDSTVVLRELGSAKYLTYLDDKKRAEQQKHYDGITFLNTNETKTILGYECRKVIARLADGTQYSIFYAPNIIPSFKGFEPLFRDLPGLALEYEALAEDNKNRVKYVATRITLTPVPIALFDTPKSGYRLL